MTANLNLMTADNLFSIGNSVALIGWILLIIAPLWKSAEKLANGVIVTLLSMAYAALVVMSFRLEDFSQFGSLQGVKSLFQNDFMLLAGWVHYLAFDLFVGCWIYRNARAHRVPHILFIVCGFFTFMLGPCGLLIYLIIRTLRGRKEAQIPAHG